jgi:predicted nucleic acid-binding protein
MVVKRRPLLYIETSVFGFYYDEEPRNALRREAVRELFRQIELGILDAATSPVTTSELVASKEPLKGSVLELLSRVAALRADETEVRRLAEEYLKQGVMPAAEQLDALHAAYATVGRAEIIVSLNIKHLANTWAERQLNAVNLREGYPMVSVRTPEQVVRYEN